ncbi:NAD(P)H-dependent oxidoreductase [Dyadobacter frigoris]|uniref:NAD(P)H-dependent oxidoreductase n=1 Tax=Dyadobacter frigoris TaxID=2576211 RepID=A0A4U6CXP8_9BACT|nr:NAD(P)H-dependent oxidoreductase [Dyadobacter frigoris]TKT89589.1 NAD(P)H-dependent oxidoreductase [Dyadobacter frigoris]GLU54196.1 NAD(P)H dehydrogenase (quinone) [Dyadobacter frigoris]
MRKILIINGHPDPESFAAGIADAYKKGALQAGAEIKELLLSNLDFNPILQFGYRKRTELEPDLLDAQQKILWAEHIVWVYPVWWGGTPALLKGFIDRTFLPGFAFKYRDNSVWWDKLLTGRSAHIISTLDQPAWYYWLVNGRPTYHTMKKMTLEFSGFKPVRTTTFGPIRKSTEEYRTKWLVKIEQLGRNLR